MKPNLLIAAFVLFVLPFASAHEPEIWIKKGWDYALDGYDTVAYFTDNAAVEGDDRFVTEYKDAKWRFASQKHLDMFKADPDKYRPQYGGHCAYGLGKNGVLVNGDPERWTIVDDKLYLNLNKRIQKKWQQNEPFYIQHADAIWPRALDEEIDVDW